MKKPFKFVKKSVAMMTCSPFFKEGDVILLFKQTRTESYAKTIHEYIYEWETGKALTFDTSIYVFINRITGKKFYPYHITYLTSVPLNQVFNSIN